MSSSTGTVVFNDSRIKATGVIATESIGVGTANPTSNLHVVGDASIQSNLEVGTANLFVDTTTGNVGVGKTNPGTALEVYSSTGTQLTLSSSSRYTTIYGVDDTGSCFFGNDGGSFRITTGGDTSGTGASEALRVNSSGNVGIGTANPIKKIDLGDAGGDIRMGHDTDTTVGTVTNSIGRASTNGQFVASVNFINEDVDDAISFTTHEAGVSVEERMRIRANGNVGIGTATPTAKLDVNGYIKNKNPVFHAYRSSTWTTGSYATIPFNVEVHDSTNSYNTNGTFTAPVAGYYFFSVFALTNGAINMHLEFHKNGALTNGAEPYSDNVGSYACVSGSIVIYLNVNDYVEVVMVSGGIYGGGNHHNGFCGYLIG